VIEGLTPTIDEHSIKVDGTGAATITDLSVQLIDNKENYDDIYPSDDESDEDSDDEDESEEEEDAIKAISDEIKQLELEAGNADEIVNEASARLTMLETYGGTLKSDKRPESIEKFLNNYNQERAKAFATKREGLAKAQELREKVQSLNKKKARLGKAAWKAQLKKQVAKQKKLAKKQRRIAEARQEKAKIKAERVKFWPKKIFKVIISIDAPQGFTPASSRRGSIDDIAKPAVPEKGGPVSDLSTSGDINLSLSYITYSASWSPRYDLSLNSVTNSGVLDYCAELKNNTSESWRDTKVILSTSQTSYQGLEDTIPVMQPWHVRLIKNGFGGRGKGISSLSSEAPALYSQYEQDHKKKNMNKEIPAQVWKPRKELFGLEPTNGVDSYMPLQQQQQQHIRPQSNVAYPPRPMAQAHSDMVGAQMLRKSAGMSNFPVNPFSQQQSPSGTSNTGFTSAANTRLFGDTSNTASGGLFGSQPATMSTFCRPGGFGNASAFGGGFGSSSSATGTGLFGSITSAGVTATSTVFGSTANAGATAPSTLFGAAAPAQPSSLFANINSVNKAAETFGAAPERSRGLFFGGSSAPPPPPAPSGAAGWGGNTADGGSVSLDEDAASYDEDDNTISAQDPALLFEESSFSDSGMTTTYDLPSLKTVAPASTTTKHKIARVEFKSVIFSHILIPKLKAAAYLKARLRNASKITLLKGTAGLTLDGSFLGQSTIPRCSAGDSFTLPLGVDPTISVSYAKPTVRRSQSGIFSKEDCEVYTRIATVTNTKHNATVELTVLDQIPVSEDERLRIEIVSPRGLRIGGETVPAGQNAQSGSAAENETGSLRDGKSAAGKSRLSIYGDDGGKNGSVRDGKWGSALALAKKDGEVNWNVKINPLKGCKLVLEYEATYPGGEMVSGIN
jgi:hypothetical protein